MVSLNHLHLQVEADHVVAKHCPQNRTEQLYYAYEFIGRIFAQLHAFDIISLTYPRHCFLHPVMKVFMMNITGLQTLAFPEPPYLQSPEMHDAYLTLVTVMMQNLNSLKNIALPLKYFDKLHFEFYTMSLSEMYNINFADVYTRVSRHCCTVKWEISGYRTNLFNYMIETYQLYTNSVNHLKLCTYGILYEHYSNDVIRILSSLPYTFPSLTLIHLNIFQKIVYIPKHSTNRRINDNPYNDYTQGEELEEIDIDEMLGESRLTPYAQSAKNLLTKIFESTNIRKYDYIVRMIIKVKIDSRFLSESSSSPYLHPTSKSTFVKCCEKIFNNASNDVRALVEQKHIGEETLQTFVNESGCSEIDISGVESWTIKNCKIHFTFAFDYPSLPPVQSTIAQSTSV